MYPSNWFKKLLSGVNSLYNLSDLAYHKFIQGIAKNTIYHHKQAQVNNSFNFSNAAITLSYQLRIKLFIQIVRLIISFFLASFAIKVLYSKNTPINNKKFLFITSQGKTSFVDLYGSNNTDYIVGLIPSFISIKNYNKYKNNYILNTFSINYCIIKTMFVYCNKYGVLSNSVLKKSYEAKEIIKFNDILLKGIIYNDWADKLARQIQITNPNIVVVVENDAGGPTLFLVDKLNKFGIKTLHVQHGSYTSDNLFYVPPLSSYMLCCSKRELEIQERYGVNKEKLYLFGAPFQTLKDSERKVNSKSKYLFDFLILGGSGPKMIQTEYTEFLRRSSKYLLPNRILLRNHPANSKEEDLVWVRALDMISNIAISHNKYLIKDLDICEIVISFSIDALISCIRQRKKTIFYTVKHGKTGYEFLKEIKTVKTVTNEIELKTAIDQLISLSKSEFETLYNIDLITENFGEYDVEKVKENFTLALGDIYNRK